jgi:DNA polymerase III alpha subunit (gram-positive type)
MLEVKMTDYSSSFIVQKWGRKPEEQAMFDLVKKVCGSRSRVVFRWTSTSMSWF